MWSTLRQLRLGARMLRKNPGHRDLRQPREFPVTELGILVLQDALGCRPAQPLVRAVHLRQQRNVGGRIFGSEPLPPIDLCPHFPGLSTRSNQSRNLRQAQPGDLAQVRPDRSPLLPPLLLPQWLAYPVPPIFRIILYWYWITGSCRHAAVVNYNCWPCQDNRFRFSNGPASFRSPRRHRRHCSDCCSLLSPLRRGLGENLHPKAGLI
jgi:hypothetical protein